MTEPKKIQPVPKPHVPTNDCLQGYHTYIVTCWLIGGGKEKAVQIRCQHCLMPKDLTEIEMSEWSKKEGLSG